MKELTMSLAQDMAGCAGRDEYSAPGSRGRQIVAGGTEISYGARWIKANGIQILLRPTEFRLLHFFMTHADRVYSRSRLLDRVWSKRVLHGESKTVDMHVRRLRTALEPLGLDDLIQTVRGYGYRFSTIRNEPENALPMHNQCTNCPFKKDMA